MRLIRSWEARAKRAGVELDGITGESSTSGRAFQQQVRRIFNRDVLFDLGAESINLAVPGVPLRSRWARLSWITAGNSKKVDPEIAKRPTETILEMTWRVML